MGPAEQEEGGSLEVLCQPNIPLGMISRGSDVACSRMAPHFVAAHASKRASEPRSRDKGHYVPAEIGKLLVDALESHGCCVYV